jgi:hypothetical protein
VGRNAARHMKVAEFQSVVLGILTLDFGHLRPACIRKGSLEFRMGQLVVNFSNLYKRAEVVEMTTAAVRKEVRRWVRTSTAAVELAGRRPSFEEARMLLRPQLFPRQKAESAILNCGFFTSDLQCCTVLDDHQVFRYVGPMQKAMWGRTTDELFAQARENLEVIVARQRIPRLREAPFEDCCIFNMVDGYAAARILLGTIRRRVKEKIGLPFFFGVPSRDFLVCWSPSKKQSKQQEAFEDVRDMYRVVDHPLSPCTFVVERDFTVSVHAVPVLAEKQHRFSCERSSAIRSRGPIGSSFSR